MSYINTNIDHYTKFMESNLSINGMDVKKATSPTTILEYIIDFITLGGVRKELNKQYNKFCSKIVDTIEQSNNSSRYEIPKDIKFSFSGKDVIFSNDNGFFYINVEGKAAEKRIDEKLFNNFCTIQLLMKREGLSENQVRLTNDRNICLENADLSNRNLSGIDLRGAELYDVNLSNSDLSFSNLKGAKLKFTRFDSVCYGKQAERNTYMRNLCDYLKTTYQIDSEGKRNSKSDDLFRAPANHTDFLDIKKSFDEGKINFEEHSVHSLRKILADECKRLSPIDDLMLVEVESRQEEFLSIFNKKVQSMIPEERKEFEIILGLYADAYDSAEDGTTSSFNKHSILTGSFYPSLFFGAGQALDIKTINKQKEFSKEIITSFKHLNIYANSYELNNELVYSKSFYQNDDEPIYSGSHNKSNQHIYEDIKFYSSETPSNKYYKGPINGDIYAKVDKKNIDKSELLKEIDNFILENSEKYPLAYQYVRKYA